MKDQETHHKEIDFSKPHRILEKLDGSMITPLLINGEIRFCSKMGLTDVGKQVDDYGKTELRYWCRDIINQGYTPIFEWCSRQQRIVIDYHNDILVLIAIRHNVSGEYVQYDEMVKDGL